MLQQRYQSTQSEFRNEPVATSSTHPDTTQHRRVACLTPRSAEGPIISPTGTGSPNDMIYPTYHESSQSFDNSSMVPDSCPILPGVGRQSHDDIESPSAAPVNTPAVVVTPTCSRCRNAQMSPEHGQALRTEIQLLSSSISPPQSDITRLTTPDGCPIIDTSHPPISDGRNMDLLSFGAEILDDDFCGLSFSNDLFNPDYTEFSQFALSLPINAHMLDTELTLDNLV